jgi:hypothetical protein
MREPNNRRKIMSDKPIDSMFEAVKGSVKPVFIVSCAIALGDALAEFNVDAFDGSSVLLIPLVLVIGVCAVALVETAKAAVVTVRGVR